MDIILNLVLLNIIPVAAVAKRQPENGFPELVARRPCFFY